MNKKIIIVLFFYHFNIYSGASLGTQANYDLIKQQKEITENINAITTAGSSTNASGTNNAAGNCNCPQAASATAMPCLVIDLFNSASTILNAYTFATNSNFSSAASIMLQVDIFPASTVINNGIVSFLNTKDHYAIIYTLKSLDGALLQKFFQYHTTIMPTLASPACASFITPTGSTNNAPILLNPAIQPSQFPVSIAISSPTSTTTPGTQLNALIETTFLMFPSGLTAGQKQQWFNNAAPITQKFLINPSSSSGLSITPISGSYNSTPTAAQSPFASGTQLTASNQTQGSTISALTFQITDGTNPQQFIFGGQSSPFNSQDLANGLVFMLYAYPATNGVSGMYDTYVLIGVLKTIDGFKFQKQILPTISGSSTPTAISFNPAPTTLTISNANNTPIFSTTFLNANTSYPLTTAAINLAAPITCCCLLQGTANAITVTQVP